MREVLNRIPGVNAPENTGTGSHDLAMNFGIRGLNPRLASRSTVLMDGIPVPFAPTVNLSYRWRRYRWQHGCGGCGSRRRRRALRAAKRGRRELCHPRHPAGFAIAGGVEGQLSPTSSQNNPKETHNLMLGGTADNGLGAALLYSGTRGSDWREHSATRIDDVMLKGKYAPNAAHVQQLAAVLRW
jgi:Fe(3+) dicitrate transport protein